MNPLRERAELARFDLNLLRTLVVLGEERSTVRAAKRLFLSQPTISGALARLREIFSDELFVRSGRNLEPTARALELIARITPHLESIAEAASGTAPFQACKDHRVFRFGCTDAVSLAVLPRLTRVLRKAAPACDLVVRIGDYRTLPGMLASAEIATALGYLRVDPPAATKVKVVRRSAWVVVRCSTARTLADLDDFCARPHVLITPLGDLWGFVDVELKSINRARRSVIGVASFASLLSILPGSDMIATVPDFVAHELVRFSSLAVDPCPIAVPVVTNTLAWRAVTDRDPAETWFRQQLVKAFRQRSTH